ncbi:MAG: hypothetical protein KatS3mg031_0990 [Chitinophagales bacterium]|nr:MAG: hypothetical protein KatS3mg031_0990 [Chitinophagales bacterium]
MNYRKALGSLLFLACLSASGQDIHFSQYFASPLTLNPALVGGFNGKFRVAANYRNQWFTVMGANSYVTYSGSFDMPILRRKLGYDQLGVGVMAFHDKAGDGALSTLNVMGGAAYHKNLDEQRRYVISLGVLAGFTQKRIDFSRLTFAAQFDQNLGFDPLAFNGERIESNSTMYFDFTVGLLFRARFSKMVRGYVGGSMFHLHKPKEYFLVQNGQPNRLNPRFLVHGGVDISVNKYFTLTPGIYYATQNTASEITVGMAAGYMFNENNILYLGAWVRAFDQDAVIPMIAYEVYGLRIGLSYDINLSDLKVASNSHGAVEASLIYIFGKEPEPEFSPSRYCPKF